MTVRPAPLLLALGLAGSALLLPGTAGTAVAADPGCGTSTAPLSFGEPVFVDETRAGGEPIVATHPDGRLLYGSHAGSTHFYTPAGADPTTAAFVQNYTGQTYAYFSEDNGATWNFVPRTPPTDTSGAPASGFSDPEFAIDAAGNVFYSEINLANIAMSASYDGGRTYQLQNFAGAVLTDRQWMEADRENEYYFVANAFGGGTGTPPSPGTGHFISKTTDGGRTFTTNVADRTGGSGLGDIRVDKTTGTVYESHYGTLNGAANTISVAAFRDARSGNLVATDTNPVASDVRLLGPWPTIDVDPAGNVYITWDESGAGSREAGIYYSYSTDGARTWADPVQVADSSKTRIWPWLAVGDAGKVGIAWLEADVALPGNDAESTGDHGWRLYGATTTAGLGCGDAAPEFSTALMTPDPVHTGTICQGGTTCQAFAIDRRLGDYFSVDIDSTGMLYAGYSDTSSGGAVALPGFVRQNGGDPLVGSGAPTPVVPEAPLSVLLPLAAAGLGAALLTRRRRGTATA